AYLRQCAMPRSPGCRIMRSLHTTTLVLSLALLLAAPPARAGAPTDQLRLQVDRVLKLLDDPTLKDKPKDKRVAARKIADDIFDFGETARRSLGRHWAARTQAEPGELVKKMKSRQEEMGSSADSGRPA